LVLWWRVRKRRILQSCKADGIEGRGYFDTFTECGAHTPGGSDRGR
jgi:hypothetical protein